MLFNRIQVDAAVFSYCVDTVDEVLAYWMADHPAHEIGYDDRETLVDLMVAMIFVNPIRRRRIFGQLAPALTDPAGP